MQATPPPGGRTRPVAILPLEESEKAFQAGTPLLRHSDYRKILRNFKKCVDNPPLFLAERTSLHEPTPGLPPSIRLGVDSLNSKIIS
jgi:hypothetical protein